MTDKYEEYFRTRHIRKLRRQLKSRAMGTCTTFGIAYRFALWLQIRGAIAVTLGLAMSSHALADEPGQGPCVPSVTDYQTAYGFAGDDFAVIWWCESEYSLESFWWTDTVSKSNPAYVLRLASRDPDEFKRQLEHRWSTVDQITLAMQIQAEQGPRCYSGQYQVTCNSWKTVDGKLLCDVSGRIQTDGSRLPADSWALCELRKAPVEGWQ